MEEVTEGRLGALGYQQYTSLSTVTTLTDIPTDARLAVIQAEAQAVRYRTDGANPSATVGMVLADGERLVIPTELAKLRFIQVAASAKLNVEFFR